MKAARLVGPKLFEFLDADMPVANDGQVLIKLERVSVQLFVTLSCRQPDWLMTTN